MFARDLVGAKIVDVTGHSTVLDLTVVLPDGRRMRLSPAGAGSIDCELSSSPPAPTPTPTPPTETLGARITRLRNEKGMSLRALANVVGLSPAFMSDLEHNRRSCDRLGAIALALGVDKEVLTSLDKRETRGRLDVLEARVARLEKKLGVYGV